MISPDAETPSGTGTSANGSFSLSPMIVAEKKFIAGEPMKPATKMLTGSLYRFRGVETCCSTPERMTATRSPSVIASVWSWVT